MTHRAGVFSLVHIIPAVGFDVLGETSTLVLAQLLHGLGLDQHSVNGDRFLLQFCDTLFATLSKSVRLRYLRTIEHVWGLLVEDDGLPIDVSG